MPPAACAMAPTIHSRDRSRACPMRCFWGPLGLAEVELAMDVAGADFAHKIGDLEVVIVCGIRGGQRFVEDEREAGVYGRFGGDGLCGGGVATLTCPTG